MTVAEPVKPAGKGEAVELPVVDLELRKTDPAEFDRRLKRGMFQTGFFYLKGVPGLDQPFIDEVISKCHAFFDLPQAKKDSYSIYNNSFWRGYVKLGDETTHYAQNYRENFDAGIELSANDPNEESIPLWQRMLRGPNIWPTEEDVPGYRATLEKYFQLCFDTNITLLHLILEGLGYPKDKLGVYDKWFRLDQGLEPMLLAKVSHYPPIREVDIATESEKREPKEWVQGCGPHTDTAFFTLLAQDQPGLQVQLHDGRWIDAPVLPGTLVINFGRQLADLTHNVLEATTHRVNTALVDERRVSVPYFLVPSFQEDLPKFITEEKAAEILREYRPQGVVTDVDPDWDGDNLDKIEDRIITNRVRQYPEISRRFWPKQWVKYGLPTEEEVKAVA